MQYLKPLKKMLTGLIFAAIKTSNTNIIMKTWPKNHFFNNNISASLAWCQEWILHDMVLFSWTGSQTEMHQVFHSTQASDLENAPRSIIFGKTVKVYPEYIPAKCESRCSHRVWKCPILKFSAASIKIGSYCPCFSTNKHIKENRFQHI